MTPDQIREFKKLFETQRTTILASQDLTGEEFSLSKDDLLDEMDLTSSELEQSMRIRLRNRQTLYLKKIEQALARIKEGSFGDCQACGEHIEVRRLEARPTTTHCVGCKEEEERREALHIDGHKHKSVGERLRLRLA
jgi:DnaK suppressor protein